ncbi:MAG TPA: AAA family ATPase [Candidatus Saccharimonadales bacterium]|nr:AAA family ATPase [Candidatus Saccharimonadales bacterium]
MNDELILHEATAQQISQFIANPTHAVLLAGPDGIGKTAISESIIAALLDIPIAKLVHHPYITRVIPTGNTISIDAVRELQRFLQLKTLGTQTYRRAVLIEHASALTTEAQNAYLKLLEEPPSDTIMVLTASSPRTLLPTIRSRLQTITVHTPDESQLQALIQARQTNDTAGRQAYFLSGGLPGLITALLAEDQAHPLLTNVTTAKALLQKQPFERLCMVDALSKQKETTYGVLEALARIASTGLSGAATKHDAARIKQWHAIRKATLAAREALERSTNTKLVLTNLFLNLS